MKKSKGLNLPPRIAKLEQAGKAVPPPKKPKAKKGKKGAY